MGSDRIINVSPEMMRIFQLDAIEIFRSIKLYLIEHDYHHPIACDKMEDVVHISESIGCERCHPYMVDSFDNLPDKDKVFLVKVAAIEYIRKFY
jgi:hypothetical protein